LEKSVNGIECSGQIPQIRINKQGQIWFEDRLKDDPELKAKIEAMLAIIENAGGDLEHAAEAEPRLIEEMRQTGHEGLHSGARRQQQKKEDEYHAQWGVNRKRKKNSTDIGGWAESK
jgi:hypothetical protein